VTCNAADEGPVVAVESSAPKVVFLWRRELPGGLSEHIAVLTGSLANILGKALLDHEASFRKAPMALVTRSVYHRML
jgi:hypothetical protein